MRVVCLKRETAAEVVHVFKTVFTESQTPLKLQTDAGKEFLKKGFQALVVHFGACMTESRHQLPSLEVLWGSSGI